MSYIAKNLWSLIFKKRLNLVITFLFSVLDDECRDMMCGGSCQYNYGDNEFACTCPENTYLNDDGSSCVQFDDSEGKLKQYMV